MQSAWNLRSGQCGLSDGSGTVLRLPSVHEWRAMVDKRYQGLTLSNAAGTGQWKEGEPFSGVQTDKKYYLGKLRIFF